MNPKQFERVEELFNKVVDLGPKDRDAILSVECKGDSELRRKVEALLGRDREPESTIEVNRRLAFAAVQNALTGDLLRDYEPDLPERIGRYRPIRVIGQGGMGIVYEAEQDQPKRLVALKVLARQATSRQMLQRFRQEAEILGRLKHPGVAQIFDSGRLAPADGGLAYLVMELIDGRPLHKYAAEADLDVTQRLELFALICDAVQHAHQKGVIHRDLKPDNILVTADGTPKILDFGIARVTDSDLQVTMIQTNQGQLVGTITYMSPEQVSCDLAELDLRSDIYALGVLLFELLAGKLPHDIIGRSIPDAVRIIQEVDPLRLSSIDTFFRGDVDIIVAKALEKDASRRYASVAEMAADIRRHLSHEPISARPASTFYQLSKFARRHKPIVGGVLATVLALAVGLVFSINFALNAKRSEALAQWTAYTLGITAAGSLIDTDPIRAAGDLNSLPESLRNWEWYHVYAQLDSSVASCAGEGLLSSAAFLADGTPVAALIRNGAVTLVDVNTCEAIKDFGPAPKLEVLNLSADGAWLGGFDPDRQEISIWDVTKGVLVNRIPFQFDSGAVGEIRFSPTGRLCYIMSTQGSGRSGVLDVHSGQFDRAKDASDVYFLDSAYFRAVGRWDGAVERIDLQGGSVVRSELRGSYITCLSVSPDGNAVAVGTDERAIHLLDGQLVETGGILAGHGSSVSDVLFLQDNVLASASRDGTVRIWDLPSRLTTRTMNVGAAGSLFKAWHVTLAASPDGTQILSFRGGEVTLLDLEASDHRLLSGHSNYAYFATHSPDGTMIASYAYDNKLILWDALTDERLATMPCDETKYLPNGLAFTHDGSHLIAMTRFEYTVWNVATGQRENNATATDVLSDRMRHIKETQPQDAFIQALFEEQAGGGARFRQTRTGLNGSVSGDGTLLVRGNPDGGIDIVTRKDMNVVSSLAGHETEVFAVAISADNTLIASADKEGVAVWNRADGREIARFGSQGGKTYCLDFSPDGARLVSGDQDGVIRLWDTGSYKMVAELKGHGSYVHSVLFSPDGTQLVSASGDHSVRIWDTVTIGERRKQAQAAATLREEMAPMVDRLLEELVEPSRVAAQLRGDKTLDESHRAEALRVLLIRSNAERTAPPASRPHP